MINSFISFDQLYYYEDYYCFLIVYNLSTISCGYNQHYYKLLFIYLTVCRSQTFYEKLNMHFFFVDFKYLFWIDLFLTGTFQINLIRVNIKSAL